MRNEKFLKNQTRRDAMKNGNGFVMVGAAAIAEALVKSEIRFLSEPDAGPYEIPVRFNGTTLDSASALRGLGGYVIVGENGSTRRFSLPKRYQVLAAVRRERDEVISTHSRSGNHVRERGTGKPCKAAEYDYTMVAINRLLDILSQPQLGANFTSRA